MRSSRLFSQTLREAPADAEIRSHNLLVRTGFEPLAMYPSDLVVGMLSDDVLREVSARPEGQREMVEL